MLAVYVRFEVMSISDFDVTLRGTAIIIVAVALATSAKVKPRVGAEHAD